MVESQMNLAKHKKTGSKNYILYDSLYKVLWKRQNYREKNRSTAARARGRERGTAKKPKGILEGDLNVQLLHCDGNNTIVCSSKLIELYTKSSGLSKIFLYLCKLCPSKYNLKKERKKRREEREEGRERKREGGTGEKEKKGGREEGRRKRKIMELS